MKGFQDTWLKKFVEDIDEQMSEQLMEAFMKNKMP